MKYLIALLISFPCFAQEYHFIYNMPIPAKRMIKVFHLKVQADSLPEAIEKGGRICYQNFMDLEWETLDVCANPDVVK